MAATWLENISGNPNDTVAKKDKAKDPILKDLRAMMDVETRERGAVESLPPPRHDQGRAPMHLQQQPKPKFVAHKDPVKGKNKKGKESPTSDRLGGNHMA